MKIDPAKIKELREKTGAGILSCKQALQKAEGDLERAIDTLRAEGLVKAAQREGKEAREGLISLRVGEDGKKAALLELNCETDFVARTPEFRELGDSLLKEVFRGGADRIREEDLVRRVQEVSGRTGEKLEAGRALVWEKEGFIGSYLHHNRKVAVLVELSLPDEEAGREIAMQVAAANPEYLDAAAISSEVQEKEKAIFLEQVRDKPENIREKIVEGKWRKRLTELCLLEQPYLKEPSLSVAKYLRQRGDGLTVKSYVRWRLGEE
jgi:elongation factor Ts